MGTGYHGGFGQTSRNQEESMQKKQKLPENEAQVKHIFSGKEGHFIDTPQNREILVELANDENKYYGNDQYGNSWNIEITADGKQNWVRYRNGIINEGGQNKTPREWDDDTGLNKNPFKRRKK